MTLKTTFEKELTKLYLPLTVRLTKIENQITRLIMRTMAGAKISHSYWNKAKRELDYLYVKMNLIYRNWALNAISDAYKFSVYSLNKRVEAMDYVLNKASKSVDELLRMNASRQIVHGLTASATESFLASSLTGRQNIKALFTATQQRLVSESLVNVAVGTGFEMGGINQARILLTSIFTSPQWDIVRQKSFIQAGKMKYTPSYYAEMVARTKFHQAHSQAALVQAINYKTDLMQISSHNTVTPICMPFEGKIFSISGNDPRFPVLVESPPFHPNCLHLEFLTFESALIQQGTLDSFSAFSKGKINRPPVPSSFIPIGDRAA